MDKNELNTKSELDADTLDNISAGINHNGFLQNWKNLITHKDNKPQSTSIQGNKEVALK